MRLIRRFAMAAAIVLAIMSPPAMRDAAATVNSAANKTIVLGNGAQTQFAFSFIGVASAYISVIYTDAAGNETVLTQGNGSSQYQISLNAPVAGAIWGMGGTVTFNPGGTPIAAGTTLTIFRTLPLTQAITLQNQASIQVLGRGAETGLDTGVMQSQQISETINRAIVAPIVDATPPAPLPPIAQRANQGAAFDGQGNLVAGTTPASGVISSAMQPVVNAATIPLGRAALGLGNIATFGVGVGLQDDGAGNVRVNSTALTAVATNQTVTANFAEQTYVATGPINFTLPRANTLWNGFAFAVYTISGPVTLVPNAGDSVQGQASGVPLTIPPKSYALVISDAATSGNWRVAWSGTQLPSGYSKLVISNNATTPNTKIDGSAAALSLTNSVGFSFTATNVAFTVDLTTGTSSPTPNGMDGEAIPANGDLFLWAISDGQTVAGLGSTSSISPALPPNYTFKKYIGAMKTASSILLRTRQVDRRTQYVVVAGSNVSRPPVMGVGPTGGWSQTSPAATTLNVSPWVPSTASTIIVLATNNRFGTGTGGVIVAPDPGYFGTNNGPQGTNGVVWPLSLNDNSAVDQAMAEMQLTGSSLYWAAFNGNGAVACFGWIDASL